MDRLKSYGEIMLDSTKAKLEYAQQEVCRLRAALDAADRLAAMVKQYGVDSDVTMGDIAQEYEFYQSARAAVDHDG